MYNKIVEALKEIARNALRMKIMVKLQSELAYITNQINHSNTNTQEIKKDIARAQFKQTQIVDTDPDKEEKNKQIENRLKEHSLEIESVNEEIKILTEQKTNKEKEITAIENGEVKVSLDKLNNLTKELITEITKDIAIARAKELI